LRTAYKEGKGKERRRVVGAPRGRDKGGCSLVTRGGDKGQAAREREGEGRREETDASQGKGRGKTDETRRLSDRGRKGKESERKGKRSGRLRRLVGGKGLAHGLKGRRCMATGRELPRAPTA
jgi:hypothetical protein